MTLQLFLNDLSVPDEACPLEIAIDRLRALVATLRRVNRIGRPYVLHADRPFAETMLGADRPLAALRNEAGLREENLYIRTVADRSPWTTALAMRPPDAAGGAEYLVPDDAPVAAGRDAVALGLAQHLAGLAISLPSHAHWMEPAVGILRVTLDGDAVEVREPVQAPNASHPDHVARHAAALLAADRPSVHDGAELWARRAELFPHLRFVPTVRGQMEGLPHRDPNLDGALDRLLEIDAAIDAWRASGAPRPAWTFSVSPESTQRIQDGLVDIKDANGVVRTFSDHARYGPDENRIHFIVETEPDRHALVGHVGRKLGIGA